MTEENKNALVPVPPQSTAIALSTEFERQASAVAYQFNINYNSVKFAFKDSPASLSATFNEMERNRRGRNRNIGWTIAWGVLVWPIAIFPGVKIYKYNNKLNELGMRVKAEVETKVMDAAAQEPKKPLALPPPLPPSPGLI